MLSAQDLFDFGVITIFARETLEGGIIIGEYRTIILRTDWRNNPVSQEQALRAVTVSALAAAAAALVLCAAISIPLAVLSRDFNAKTAILIEGVSKIVAAICILQLSLKMPKFLGLYSSKSNIKKTTGNKTATVEGEEQHSADVSDNVTQDETNGLTLRSIRFNVAWTIWREVAECGVFLIPFFLSGEGIVVGAVICLGIYYANLKMKSKVALTIFTVSLLMILSTGLFMGGCHKFEIVYGSTPVVWQLKGDFWKVDRLPMTIFKPFGYSDTRTVLMICCFWFWGAFGCLLHYRKWRQCKKSIVDDDVITKETEITTGGLEHTPSSSIDAEEEVRRRVCSDLIVEDVEVGTATTPEDEGFECRK
jgi:high-affinity iron transporter